jgi:hypothetical protein
MKHILFVVCLALSFFSNAQQSFSEADAKHLIDTFFEGFHKGDTLLMQSTLSSDAVLQTAMTDTEGAPTLTMGPAQKLVEAVSQRPASQRWEERLLGHTVHIDGNLAHVWTPYEFWLNGNFSHCGANAFTLAKLAQGWKIIHIIDSRRTLDCR